MKRSKLASLQVILATFILTVSSQLAASQLAASQLAAQEAPASARTDARQSTRQSNQKPTRQPYKEPTQKTMMRLDSSQAALKFYSKHFSENWNSVESESLPVILEGLATETILAEVIRAVYTEALRRGWQTADRFSIFPIHQSAMNSQIKISLGFNSEGARVAVFGLRLAKRTRGIILTSHYRPTFPGEIERQFRLNQIHDSILAARGTFNTYAKELLERMESGDPRESEYLPLSGSARSWVLGCEKVIGESFCVNARVFDATDTRTDIFYDTLMGHTEQDPRIRAIKATRLAWPIKKSYISRGFKFECQNCERNHYGLDLATPKGTLIHAVQSGLLIKMGTLSGWGNTIVIEHQLENGEKFVSLYAHLSKFRKGLKVGHLIGRGEIIAQSGNTGTSSGPHLHLEIRYAQNGRESLETLRQPRSQIERPLDPLRVLDVFNIFVEGDE